MQTGRTDAPSIIKIFKEPTWCIQFPHSSQMGHPFCGGSTCFQESSVFTKLSAIARTWDIGDGLLLSSHGTAELLLMIFHIMNAMHPAEKEI